MTVRKTCVGAVLGLAMISLPALGTVYRPGLAQAKFTGADIGFTDKGVPVRVMNLATQTEYPQTGPLDYTYGTFMASFKLDSGKVKQNPWSGISWGWNDSYSMFAYEGEIYLRSGQTVAMGGCFDDGTAASVDGTLLFSQGKDSGYDHDCTIYATYTAEKDGWYPLNAWVWDYSSGKNVRSGYVSGIAYNLVGNTDQPKDAGIWAKLVDDGRMSLLRVRTSEPDFMTIDQVGVSGEDIKVRMDALGLPDACPKATATLYWGASDGGMTAANWEHAATLGEIAQGDKGVMQTFTAAGAASAAFARVCLSYDDEAADVENNPVSSFACWSDAFSGLSAFDGSRATGRVGLARGVTDDEQVAFSVGTYGENASAATAVVQFSSNASFVDAVESDAVELTGVDMLGSVQTLDFHQSFGRSAGFLRLKIVNDQGETSYSEPVEWTPPAAISFSDYSHKVVCTVTYAWRGAAADDAKDFPVLVRLAPDAPKGFDYADCAADGSDLAFFDAAGTVRYSYDIDTWNPDGESCVWVRLPSAVRGAKFVMCYGRENVADAASSERTWGNYIGVWHLGEDGGTAVDATGHGLDGQPTSGTKELDPLPVMVAYENGVVGRARVGNTQNGKKLTYLAIPSPDAFAPGDTFTISGWFFANDISGYPRLFSRKKYSYDSDGFEIFVNDGNRRKAKAYGSTDKNQSVSWPDLTKGWMHLALVYQGATLNVYVNGRLVKSGEVNPAIDNGRVLSIGCTPNGEEETFNGQYDEIRLSKEVKSAARIAAEYAVVKGGFLADGGAVSTDAAMPVLSAAEVVWTDHGTEVAFELESGAGDVSAVFTDLATGTEYPVALAANVDATDGSAAGRVSVSADDLPLGAVYAWRVLAANGSFESASIFYGGFKYAAGPSSASVRFVAVGGSDENDGLTPATAFATIQPAIDALGADGGTVYVDEGDYALDSGLAEASKVCGFVVKTPVSVIGLVRDPAKTTVTAAGDAKRVFYLNNEHASISYLTVYGGTSTDGANGNVKSGSFTDGAVTEGYNEDWNGYGSLFVSDSKGYVARTLFKNNGVKQGGCALRVEKGLVENCLFTGNDNPSSDDGTVNLKNKGRLVNCTIADNLGGQAAGINAGNDDVKAVNCLIFGNVAKKDTTGYQHVWKSRNGIDFFSNCAADVLINEACVTGEAGFRDAAAGDYSLTPSSCAIDIGQDYAATGAKSATDFAGRERVVGETVDAGCYEYQRDGRDLDFELSVAKGLLPAEVAFTATFVGASGEVTYNWDFDGDGIVDLSSTEDMVSWTYQTAGVKNVSLTAVDDVGSVVVAHESAFVASPVTLYADPANVGGSVFPYDRPETAATNLQEAIDAAGDGSTIWLADGDYVRSTKASDEGGFVVEKAVAIRSVSGDPSACVLTNAAKATQDYKDHRCLVLNHAQALVAGVTLAGGSGYDLNGACLFVDKFGGTVSNCVIRGGRATNYWGDGGAAYLAAGLITRTVIEDCTIAPYIGNSDFGVLRINGGTVENTLIRACNGERNINIVSVASGAKFLNCTVFDCRCYAGGYDDDKHFTDSSALFAHEGSLVQNCAVVGVWRPAEDDPGTVIPAPWRGVADCFVNCATDGGAAINDTCKLIGATAFRNPAAGDFRPASGGPLVNAGAAVTLSSQIDLLGQPRVIGRRIDIGCCEGTASGFIIFVK